MKIHVRSGLYSLLSSALFIFLVEMFPPGCKNYNAVDLYPPCDTVSVTYSEDIYPIVSANCLPCHSVVNQFGGVILAVLDSARIPAQNGLLLRAVTHQSGVIPMPRGGAQLPDCEIAKIRRWIYLGEPAK